jgi:hypothetical protein
MAAMMNEDEAADIAAAAVREADLQAGANTRPLVSFT